MKDEMMKGAWCVIAAVMVVGLALLAYSLSMNNAWHPQGAGTSLPGTTATKGVTGSVPSAVSGFGQAYNTYATSGYRFEFVGCSGTPGSLSMKQGTKFMLDNRDNASHKIVVAGATYNVGPYGYAIATATTLGKYNITCDGKGAASINVQK